jgi:hypothetical protein
LNRLPHVLTSHPETAASTCRAERRAGEHNED